MIVVANGMLRSGSTLQYNVAASVLETAGPLRRAGFLGNFAREEVRAKLEALRASDGWAILKTHEVPIERAFYKEGVRVLFSYRDVRDIAASMRKKWGYPFEKILAEIDAMIELENAICKLPNVIVQSYETLYQNLHEATRELAEFLGISLAQDDLEAIVTNNAIGSSGKREDIKPGLVNTLHRIVGRRNYDRHTLLHSDHISESRGRDGDWLNQFTQDEISVLNRRYASWLSSHSYIVG